MFFVNLLGFSDNRTKKNLNEKNVLFKVTSFESKRPAYFRTFKLS